MDERAQALEGLREFRQESATLRAALRRCERMLEQSCRQVERNVPVHEVMVKVGASEVRAELVERLTCFEAWSQRLRLSVCRKPFTN